MSLIRIAVYTSCSRTIDSIELRHASQAARSDEPLASIPSPAAGGVPLVGTPDLRAISPDRRQRQHQTELDTPTIAPELPMSL